MMKKTWLTIGIACLLMISFAACADYVEPGECSENALQGNAAGDVLTQQTDTRSDVADRNDVTEKDADLYPSDCDYCGKLDGENRWFIAKVIDSKTFMPIGENCFEAVSAGEAGFILEYVGDDLIDQQGFAPGDTVRVIYNGYIVETYPCQIAPITIEPVEP